MLGVHLNENKFVAILSLKHMSKFTNYITKGKQFYSWTTYYSNEQEYIVAYIYTWRYFNET